MKAIKSFSVAIFLSGLFLVGAVQAQTSGLLFSQLADGQSTFGPSELWSASGVNSEVADDFNVIANIDRIYASGFVWGAVSFQGVYIRFYQYGADNKPGALQREYFLAAGDPNLRFDSASGAIDAKLPSAFPATGLHFLSVQPVINYWYWWSANINTPRGQAFYFRDNRVGEAWHHGDNLNLNVNADVSFYLYGTVTGAGTIDSLSATTLPRSGFVEIFGSNFGGDGTVFIGGIRAPVADWSSTRIVAYVPETAPLSTVNVKVVTSAGTSNLKTLTVTTRPAAAGHVNWRFRMDGPYSEVRAAIGPDQTVYAIDAFSHLYALTPDGGLKWLVRGAGDKGVAVGPDGIVYVASENFINAYNPDGSTKWSFVQNPRAMICLGVSVGPDGNIYSVGTEGLGVFSLTPAGALRWHQPEGYARPIVDYGEIVFGPNGSQEQLYFYANNHLRAMRLDGASVFENSSGQLSQLRPGLQPVIAPDGSVHTVLTAYTGNGTPLWSFPTPYSYNAFTAADIGSDGVHYFVQNLVEIFALNPTGSQRWHLTANSNLQGPIVDPSNNVLVIGGANTGVENGFIIGASAKDGHQLWRVTLPIEDPTVFNSSLGIYGFNQFVTARARFSADGHTAYTMTATATGDNNTSRSFVYSLNAGNGIVSAALHSTSVSLSATLTRNSQVSVNGIVTVKDANGMAVSGATVAATWTKPSGTTVNQTASSDVSGSSTFSIKGGRGTYTLKVNNITKTGYTFDRTGSVLTSSIAK